MKEYICTHCGGHVSPYSMRCEYCGTQYKIENDRIYTIETFQNPVETFTAEQVMPMEMIKAYGAEKVSEIALHNLTCKLAECIAPMMIVETEQDYQNYAQRVRATVKIVRPAKIERRW